MIYIHGTSSPKPQTIYPAMQTPFNHENMPLPCCHIHSLHDNPLPCTILPEHADLMVRLGSCYQSATPEPLVRGIFMSGHYALNQDTLVRSDAAQGHVKDY